MIIEQAYNGPLLALSWRVTVGSGLAHHGACQQRPGLLVSWWLLGGCK